MAYHLLGVTEFEPTELLTYATTLTHQRYGVVTPEHLAEMIEVIYLEDGYFLAEVFLTGDGTTLIVDEGEIGEISIEGVDEDHFKLISAYTRPLLAKRGVTQPEFERAIMLVEDIGSVSANAEIDYPEGSPQARLRVIGRKEDTSYGSLTLDHPARRLGDAATLTFSQTILDLATAGDLFRIEASATSDFAGDDSAWGAVTYRRPLGGSGLYGEGYLGTVTARRDTSGLLQQTDIEGQTAILALGYPVLRDVETYGYTLFELRHAGTDVDVAGRAFDSAVSTASASWIFGRTLPGGGAYEYAIDMSVGQQTEKPAGIDNGNEGFAFLRFGAGYEHPIGLFGPNSTIRAEFWGQYSNSRLPSIEEFYLGGRDAERGYLFAEATGDSGYSAMIEVSRDIFPASDAIERVRPFAFFDFGFVKNNRPGVGELDDKHLASVGLGLDLEFPEGLLAHSYVGVPLNDGPSTDAGDAAFYLGITKSW
ncbi:ShlB/FhaC/HecB family hemolysin secretion/activation protein [Roseovarius aestuariivivens]|uniref:ShlB/FhaC/HecB family hemolysin secretion/activation protein n=1 Tax=Roseovarius aestuariivivens TaxID=1888910 RepID=UPI001436C4F3|nr:ShlB/FhaC/HecB family hemolysin secretion/activation protein [Roseovarius aestuariivivens]